MSINAPKVGYVSLGCPKALVDSERILTQLRAEGYEFSQDYKGSDVVIVNTCGFLDSAREESLEAIGEALAENGKVIVTGCMGAEPERITERFNTILSISGPAQYESVIEAVHKAIPPLHDPYQNLIPAGGVKLTPRHYAYLKISEGCNNTCSFCIIPDLRGKLVSRPVGDVLQEAERLAKAGVKELLVISQDTSAYGIDIKYAPSTWREREIRTKFYDMCEALGELGIWVRMHYVYPYPHVDDVIPLMTEGKILPYLDIPFQHASPTILKAMKRPGNQEKVLERIAKWRDICPDITLRSTFIVGFPGEAERDFDYLLEWLEEAQLDRVGCFKYENVDGAQSHKFDNHVPEEVKDERWHRFMALQQEISSEKIAEKVGHSMEVIIDEIVHGEGYIGRTKGDAPEIDGVVHLTSSKRHLPGEIVTAMMTDSDDYDLYGTVAT